MYPEDVDCVRCSRSDIRAFAEEAKAAGVQYIGLCCGNSPNLIREVAGVYGRCPPAMKYAPDTSKSAVFGSNAKDSAAVEKLRKYMTGLE